MWCDIAEKFNKIYYPSGEKKKNRGAWLSFKFDLFKVCQLRLRLYEPQIILKTHYLDNNAITWIYCLGSVTPIIEKILMLYFHSQLIIMLRYGSVQLVKTHRNGSY